MFNPQVLLVATSLIGKISDVSINAEPTEQDVMLRARNAQDEHKLGFETVIIKGEIGGKKVRVLVSGEPGTRAVIGI